MKLLALCLCGSLSLNVALLFLLRTSPSPSVPQASAEEVRSPQERKASAVAHLPQNSDPLPAVEALRERDFRRLAAQLREAGYPEDAVRIAVASVIAYHFKKKQNALGLSQGHDPIQFWKNPVTMTGSGSPEKIAGRRALEREQRELFRSLFGPDHDVSEDTRRRRAYGLPAAVADRLHKIFADYREMEEQARDEARSTSDIAAKLELLGREKRADIERLLTAEQLLEFDLRMGAGSSLHNRLGQFEVTEAEFRALFATQQEFNAANPSLRPRERSAQFEPELRRVLGEGRYAELLAANEKAARSSRDFIEMRALVVEHNLSPSVASDVLRVQAQYEPQLRVVAENPSLTAEQKAATRATLAGAARKDLLRLLGPAAYEAYERTKSAWLPPALGAQRGPAGN